MSLHEAKARTQPIYEAGHSGRFLRYILLSIELCQPSHDDVVHVV